MSPLPPEGLSPELLSRWLSGEATEAEQAAVARWALRHPGRVAELEALRTVAAAPSPDVPVFDATAAHRKFLARRRGVVTEARHRVTDVTHPIAEVKRRARGAWAAWHWPSFAVAAAIATLALGGLSTWVTLRKPSTQAFREFASAPGSLTTITLRDGTRLVLGPATKLRVPADFGVATRQVELDGEALFAVVHDARHPFAVQTSHTTVRDVGTTFAVHAYAGDRATAVAVQEGEVSLTSVARAPVALQAHDLASVDTAGRVTVSRGVDIARYTGFAQGLMVFNRTPLRDAAEELARTYDLTVTIADSSLGEVLVTASFDRATLEEVLNVVTHVVGGHYERRGRTVVIRRGVVASSRREIPSTRT